MNAEMGLSVDVLRELAIGNTRLESIAQRLNCSKKGVVNATQVLKRRHLIANSPSAAGITPGEYVITELGKNWIAQGLSISPGQGERSKVRTTGLAERVWWHLRNHHLVTVRDILSTHTFGSERSSYIRILKYMHALEHAHIIRRAARRIPVHQSQGLVQWHLVRDLGPKVPMWRQKSNCLYDPNTNITFTV